MSLRKQKEKDVLENVILEWFNLSYLWNFEVDTYAFSINIFNELRKNV